MEWWVSNISGPESRFYKCGRSVATDTVFSTATKVTNTELMGKTNGGAASEYYHGTISGLLRFMGLTQA